MVVVIRLQGLRVTAGTEDIRRFFTGLKIPDGGVHIIGGEREEAFIIFASDEDARRAMTRSGGVIKGAPITLLLSSKTEMQTMLEKSTRNVELDQKRRLEDNARRSQRSVDPELGRRSGSRSGYTPPPQHQRCPPNDDDLRLFLQGLPFSVTEKEIRDFFSGLLINEIVLLKNQYGKNNGKGLVKFGTREHAMEGLKRDREYIGSRYVEISLSTASNWPWSTGRVPTVDIRNNTFERGRSPVLNQRNPQPNARSRSPVAQRHIAPSDDDYCVLVENLSFAVEKNDVKQLFNKAKLENDQILFLIGNDGRRTRSAFVLFKSQHDYCEALSPEKRQFFNRWVHSRSISRENMIALLESQGTPASTPENSERFQERPPSHASNPYESEKICVFMRNLPFDVRMVEIMDFFHEFNITEDKVCVMQDNQGAGVGKALVIFGSEAEAMRTLSLDGRRLLGSEVILKCISRSQMQQMGVDPPPVPEPLPRQQRYSGRSSEAYHPPDNTFYSDFGVPDKNNMPMTNVQGHINRDFDYDPHAVGSSSPRDRGNGFRAGFSSPVQPFDGPTCVKLDNLPFQIRSQEIYDFCYGYRIIPGSLSLQYDQSGKPKGSATLVFESHQEALTAIAELSGRPIGPRKIQLLLV